MHLNKSLKNVDSQPKLGLWVLCEKSLSLNNGTLVTRSSNLTNSQKTLKEIFSAAQGILNKQISDILQFCKPVSLTV